MAIDTGGLTAFERRRAENAKANNAILNSISQTSVKVFGAKATADKAKPKPKSKPKPRAPSTRARAAPVARDTPIATRRSARVAGIVAESAEDLKRKLGGGEVDGLFYDSNADAAAARAKRQRVRGDLTMDDMQVDGRWQGSLAGLGQLKAAGAQPGVRTFVVAEDDTDRKEGKEGKDKKDLQRLRTELNGLQLYDKFAVKDLKLTKDRIYSMAFHPTDDKAVVFAGDKEGHLGIFDASQEPDVPAKEEDADDADAGEHEPVIVGFKPHARTISAICVLDAEASAVYTASYDTTVRKLDLNAQKSVEVYAPAESGEDDAAISCLDFAPDDPHIAFFSTLQGALGRHDLRMPPASAQLWTDLHGGHKIGGFSLSPRQPHLVATASLDRTVRVWDVRGASSTAAPSALGEHASRLSVSHAAWGPGGQAATTSYDDTIKIYDWAHVDGALSDAQLAPVRISHNNQTGRWVTILKPQWQRRPGDGVDKFAVGNMNRFVDIFGAGGEQLAQLDGDGITAVPAVAHLHARHNWVAGGNASGKLTLWM